MKKYWIIIKNSWMRAFTYRTDLLGYRLNDIVDLFFQLTIWFVVYQTTVTIRGYSYKEMLTYVMISWLFLFLTSNYDMENYIRRDFQEGTLTNFITKPISYLRYTTVLSVGRASTALLSGATMQVLFIFLFRKQLVEAPHIMSIIIITLMIAVGYFIRLFMSILSGLFAFWITETSGLNRFFNTFIRFFSGGYMPLTILPLVIYKFSLFLPFAYLIFIPMQLYLGKISIVEGLRGLVIELLWLFVLYGIIKIVWSRGLKKYEGVGI